MPELEGPQRQQLYTQLIEEIEKGGEEIVSNATHYLTNAKTLSRREGYTIAEKLRHQTELVSLPEDQQTLTLEQIDNTRKEIVFDVVWKYICEVIYREGYEVGANWVVDADRLHSPIQVGFNHPSGESTAITVDARPNATFVIFEHRPNSKKDKDKPRKILLVKSCLT